MSNYVSALQAVLADSYSLYMKTQNYHWNVEGPHFRSLHLMFEEQYNDLFAANDEIAERIRALGEKVDGSYDGFAKRSKIKPANKDLEAMEMVQDLFDSHQLLISTMKSCLEAAQSASDEVTADLMIGRIQIHEKTSWMLRSSLPKEMRDVASNPANYAA